MKSFWQKLPKPFFVLAPMEAVTDVVFRHVVSRAARPDVYFTEFTNATGWFRAGDKAIGGRLVKTDEESLIVAQLWGSDPEAMAALSAHCAELGYDGIDINMGCPDQSAIKGGGGADMIRHPDRAAAIIAAAKTSGLPVSVKTRLGYSFVDEWKEWLEFILSQDVAALTIHLRTKKEMSKVPAHFDLIDDIIALRDQIAPHTKLTINGDIADRQQGMKLHQDHPGIDGIMIGRGIFHNPFAFEKEPRTHDQQELLDLLGIHLDLFDQYNIDMSRRFDPLKRFFKIYVKDFPGAKEMREQLMQATTTNEARAIIASALAATMTAP